ncbi:MAG: hypothetical protein GXX86_13115 [Propionibacterium sp.]|nr:hypothetical protein [Propionibacterium sp.]
MSKADEPLTHDRALAKFRAIDWITPLVLVALGGFITWQLRRPTTGPPTCDGQTMAPGDSCVVLRGGNSYTYEEKMAEYAFNNAMNAKVWPFFLAGVAVLLAVVIFRGIIEPRLAKIPPTPHADAAGHVQTTILRGAGVVIAILLFLLGYNWLRQGLHGDGPAWPAAIPWLLALVALALMSLQPRRFVRITPDDILLAEGARVRTAAWPDVRVAEQPDGPIRVHGGAGPIKVTTRYSDPALLRNRIRERVLQAHLPAAAEALAAGRSLDFGPVRATPEGLTARDAAIDWGRVANLTADGSSFTITGTDGANIVVPVRSVENRWVLEQIAEVIVRGLRGH